MAEENEDGQEKTEEPSDERREKFRKKGDVAVSKEMTSVFVLGSSVIFLSFCVQEFPALLPGTTLSLKPSPETSFVSKPTIFILFFPTLLITKLSELYT